MARLSVALPDFVRRWLHDTPPAGAPPANTERRCFRCGAGGAAATCAKCGVACYCSRECQKADWGKGGAFGGHKSLCERYKWLGREQRVPPEEHRTILTELITRTKLYVCPFFVHHAEASAPGSGFGFVQSECTLAELALPAPRDVWGRPLAQPRSLVIMWMSLEEFPEYVAETGDTRAPPAELLATAAAARAEDELLLLVRTSCGACAALVVPVVPELRVCRTLATEYAGKPVLQLDLDDL